MASLGMMNSMRVLRPMMLGCVALLAGALSCPAVAQEGEIRLQDNAPDRHVVVKGDTLWGISETFLKDPWKWPEVWQMNREQIANPHLIYPGDVVVLSMVGGKPRLSLEKAQFNETVKLSPQVRSEAIVIQEAGIASIPYQAMRALTLRGSVGAAVELDKAPYVLGSVDDRVMFAKGDHVYASKSEFPIQSWHAMRLGQPLRDPDNAKKILAYELVYLGDAETVTPGDPQVVRITANEQEILERDRLVPAWEAHPPSFMPHAPEQPVNAKVVAALGGPRYASTWMNLVINQGKTSGIEEGHVLALYRAGRKLADPRCERANKIAFLSDSDRASDCKRNADNSATLPETRVGLAFVYRVFDSMAFALVMKGTEPVTAGDFARNP